MLLQAPKGMKDVTPNESWRWQYVEGVVRDLCRAYGFLEARTPVLEHTELFLRGVGDTTDIVQKEMYTFEDKGGRSVTLKPEGTAGVARMFLEQKLFAQAQPTKMYYLYCPVFRYDKPQAGRLREHHQFGVEIYGASFASADAEVIALAMDLFSRLSIGGLSVSINSIGCPECRAVYNETLREYLRGRYSELCPVCHTRFEKNPLRILDCKEEKCRTVCAAAPSTLDCLCNECREHFEDLKQNLDTLGIPYEVDPRIVRGLDYYTKTVFEIIAKSDGFEGTVCGGGRYDGLLSQLGGPPMPAVGFGLGMERLLLVAEAAGAIPPPVPITVYVAPLGKAVRPAAMKLTQQLRAAGIPADTDHAGRSLKAQFKYADKLGASVVAVLGEDELARGAVKLKRMSTGEEREAAWIDLPQAVAALLEQN